jgi:hypothetical protein
MQPVPAVLGGNKPRPLPVTKTAAAWSITAPARPRRVIHSLPPAQVEPGQTVSFVYKKTWKHTPVPRETVLIPQPRECSNEHPQPTPELVEQVQEFQPLDKAVVIGAAVDTVSNRSSSNVPRGSPSLAVPTLPGLEPVNPQQAQPINPCARSFGSTTARSSCRIGSASP